MFQINTQSGAEISLSSVIVSLFYWSVGFLLALEVKPPACHAGGGQNRRGVQEDLITLMQLLAAPTRDSTIDQEPSLPCGSSEESTEDEKTKHVQLSSATEGQDDLVEQLNSEFFG